MMAEIDSGQALPSLLDASAHHIAQDLSAAFGF